MNENLSAADVNRIIAQAHAQRAGAFGRMIKKLFRR